MDRILDLPMLTTTERMAGERLRETRSSHRSSYRVKQGRKVVMLNKMNQEGAEVALSNSRRGTLLKMFMSTS